MSLSDRIRVSKIHREAEGYLELGLPRQALAVLARLGDPTGLTSRSMYLWGEALRSLERYDEALVPLVQAAEAEPENIHIWLALGWCYKRTGNIQMAIESLETALAAEPTEALLHYNLACYWSLAGSKDRSLQFLSQALAIEPSYRDLIATETDFDALRRDPDFQAVCRGQSVEHDRA